MAQIQEKYPLKKLLVEGNDDQHVLWALCTKFNLPTTFDVIDCGSYEKVIDRLSKLSKFNRNDIETIGIVIDADFEIEKRWESLRDILHNHGYLIDDNVRDRKSTRLNSSHRNTSRMPSSA